MCPLFIYFSPAEAPKLAHETFRAIEPGLSAYADHPEEVGSTHAAGSAPQKYRPIRVTV